MLARSPKVLLALGAILLAFLITIAGRDAYLRTRARQLPPVAVELSAERRRELEAKVVKFTGDIRANPKDFNAYVELALARSEFGDRDAAAEVYRTMNEQFPGNFLSFQNLGKLYEETGRYDFAAEQYLLAIDNAPRIAYLYRNLVNLYTYHLPARASDIPRVLEKGLAIAPGNTDLMGMLAVYYRDHGDRAEAIRWFSHLLVVDPQNTTVIEEVKRLKVSQ